MAQSRRWVFTLNNYTEEEEALLEFMADEAEYLVVGYEVGEEGTPHLQGAVVWKKPRRLAAVRKELERAHWEVMRGTTAQAAEYCKKEGEFREWGAMPGPSNKEDRKQVWRDLIAIAETQGVDEAMGLLKEAQPAVYVMNGQRVAGNLIQGKPFEGVREVVWLWGETGSGKSRTAHEAGCVPCEYGNRFFSFPPGATKVVIEEIDKIDLPLHEFLKITDRYGLKVNVKGGYQAWTPEVIYFTSTVPPEMVFPGANLPQVIRRITQIRELRSEEMEDVIVLE